jgi:hypothetical protein
MGASMEPLAQVIVIGATRDINRLVETLRRRGLDVLHSRSTEEPLRALEVEPQGPPRLCILDLRGAGEYDAVNRVETLVGRYSRNRLAAIVPPDNPTFRRAVRLAGTAATVDSPRRVIELLRAGYTVGELLAPILPRFATLDDVRNAYERATVMTVRGNVRLAAELLDVDESGLRRRLET